MNAIEDQRRAERAFVLLARGRRSGPRMYERPGFSGEERYFADLAAHAPGMNTSPADIQSVLEAEAAPELRSRPGTIAPGARGLIERARAAGWQAVTIARDKDDRGFTLFVDGQGRCAWERTLPAGLREQVACDGATLLHLYSDLGIGARRSVSRFHRADLIRLAPWLVPPAEDLARGADLESPDERTVVIVPHAVREGNEKPAAYLTVLLLFAPDGRLAERRLVLEPAGKTILREVHEAPGLVKLLDARDKELATHRWTVRPAAEPNLKPETSRLVVLPLPLRSREQVYRSLGLEPHHSLDARPNGAWECLDEEQALALLTAEYAAGNGEVARRIHQECFLARGIRRAGFWTLLAATGVAVNRDAAFLALPRDETNRPLLDYLSLQDNAIYHLVQRFGGVHGSRGIGRPDSCFRRLAGLRDLYLRWEHASPWCFTAAQREAEEKLALDFVREHRDRAEGWAVLTFVQDRARDERFHQAIAATWQLFAKTPGLAYVARYEHARSLLHGGRRDEARLAFQSLYADSLQEGNVPPIEEAFRSALESNGKDADLWGTLMRRTLAERFTGQRRPLGVLLAWQCWQLGDQALAQSLLDETLQGPTQGREQLSVTLTAIEYLMQTRQLVQADALLRPLLDDAQLSRIPSLWRLADKIASERGMTARSVDCLERALDLEYPRLPDVINLEVVRRDYRRLLEQYQAMARTITTMKVPMAPDLLTQVVRAADRWRSLDREEQAPSELAADILQTLGATELAWDYRTTPLGVRPQEARRWVELAQALQREGNHELADRAYTAAFEADPKDAQVLWDRAQNLRQAGQLAAAQDVFRRIADGDWEPGFAWLRREARWQLDRR